MEAFCIFIPVIVNITLCNKSSFTSKHLKDGQKIYESWKIYQIKKSLKVSQRWSKLADDKSKLELNESIGKSGCKAAQDHHNCEQESSDQKQERKVNMAASAAIGKILP